MCAIQLAGPVCSITSNVVWHCITHVELRKKGLLSIQRRQGRRLSIIVLVVPHENALTGAWPELATAVRQYLTFLETGIYCHSIIVGVFAMRRWLSNSYDLPKLGSCANVLLGNNDCFYSSCHISTQASGSRQGFGLGSFFCIRVVVSFNSHL